MTSFDVVLGDHPTNIAPNLDAQEINALHEMEEHWDRVHRYLISLFASWGVDDFVAEEMATPPGMEEVASLMWIKRHKEQGNYDVVIVDCAPTGETLQLLAFPDVARWYLTKIFPLERKVWKMRGRWCSRSPTSRCPPTTSSATSRTSSSTSMA